LPALISLAFRRGRAGEQRVRVGDGFLQRHEHKNVNALSIRRGRGSERNERTRPSTSSADHPVRSRRAQKSNSRTTYSAAASAVEAKRSRASGLPTRPISPDRKRYQPPFVRLSSEYASQASTTSGSASRSGRRSAAPKPVRRSRYRARCSASLIESPWPRSDVM
jgi:hypothetical protein